ncbi:hypothetical protein ACOQFV_29620 [Nocardiopsis changdeensis]|uniref:Uncharacterized protein n=1 Tax=Nocardiopsis changdeensis TaxID=2831969 RepID=A0ABX8BW44_9ACTN|nr:MULTISPECIES: hypothetical protein [Nocardiopsis]QUX25018.1 hypothetical protein KGD84_12580 [Nocardiopsis changdeensis]QYX35404.1 hypothetical protein K1J57_22030 [Nocardiopsis sp. MT53]
MELGDESGSVTVRLVGGPSCWDGVVVEGVFDHEEIYEVPVEELGALLSVPGRASPRAVYEPDPDGDRTAWLFRGWEGQAPPPTRESGD